MWCLNFLDARSIGILGIVILLWSLGLFLPHILRVIRTIVPFVFWDSLFLWQGYQKLNYQQKKDK